MFKFVKISKRAVSLLAAGLFLLPVNTHAAPSPQEAQETFQAAWQTAIRDTRLMSAQLTFASPCLQLDFQGLGRTLPDGSTKWAGTAHWAYTEPQSKESSQEDIPFYLEQTDKSLTIYAQREGKWSKLTMPGLPASVTNILKTQEAALLQENIAALKSIAIVQQKGSQQHIRVTFDAGKISQIAKKYGLVPANSPEASYMDILEKALANTDLTADWWVDSTTHETISTSMDLTPLLRAGLQAALQEMNKTPGKIEAGQLELLESLGYASELKFSMTTQGLKQDTNLDVPEGIRKAATTALTITEGPAKP